MTTDASAGSEYHRRVAAEERHVIVRAATDLLTAPGYDKVSLIQVADEASPSSAFGAEDVTTIATAER